MKTGNIIRFLLLVLISGCTSVKLSLKEIGDANVAINNAIIDYANGITKSKGGLVYNVNFEYLTEDIIGVSILEYSDEKVFVTRKDTSGSNSPYFPTRVKEIDNRLFYWYDSSSVISENVIHKLIKYDHIDSSRYENTDFIEFSFNDNKKATHYYFCIGNLTKYVKKESDIALGYGKIPRIKCN